MKLVPLPRDSGGGLGAGGATLRYLVRRNQPLVDNAPERNHGLWFRVKKVLKKSSSIQRLRVGIRFPLLASFSDPIARSGGIYNFKEARGIQKGAALVVQDTVIVGLNPNHDIRQAWGEVGIPRILAA